MGAALEAAAFHFAEQLRHLIVDEEHGPGGVRCPCRRPRGPPHRLKPRPTCSVSTRLQALHLGLARHCVPAIAPNTPTREERFQGRVGLVLSSPVVLGEHDEEVNGLATSVLQLSGRGALVRPLRPCSRTIRPGGRSLFTLGWGRSGSARI